MVPSTHGRESRPYIPVGLVASAKTQLPSGASTQFDLVTMTMASCRVLGVLCFFVLYAVNALPAQEEARGSRNAIQTENDLLDGIYADCLRKDSMSCVKYKLFSLVDKVLGQKEAITVTDGVTIVKTSDGEPEGAPRALNGGEFFNVGL